MENIIDDAIKTALEWRTFGEHSLTIERAKCVRFVLDEYVRLAAENAALKDVLVRAASYGINKQPSNAEVSGLSTRPPC